MRWGSVMLWIICRGGLFTSQWLVHRQRTLFTTKSAERALQLLPSLAWPRAGLAQVAHECAQVRANHASEGGRKGQNSPESLGMMRAAR